jgi:DNA primase
MALPVRNNDDRERVRDASDIVRVIGEHLTLKAKGREYVGLCPFHDDTKPSMQVSPAKQIFKCFACGAGGDVFSFIEKYHKMEFRESLEFLAERANITLTKMQRVEPLAEGEPAPITRNDLVRANASAADFFRTLLRHPEHGTAAREIIERRGISPEMAQAFNLGVSPDRWDGLVLTLQKLGADSRAFAEAGLLKRRESDGSFYDSFRNRVMFPIQDQIGRYIAFGARKIDEQDEPKYLNSPETRLFEKSSTLYGLFQASRSIQTERTAIITEGYTDTIACHQAGFTNAVATLGTALTRGHAAVLRRLCDTVVLLFDGDAAGQKAADRAVEVFFAEEIDVKIATLSSRTDAKDPDELLKRDGGREVLRSVIDSATDLLAYRFERLRTGLDGAGTNALSRAITEDLARLVQLGFNSVPLLRRRLIIKQIASIAGLDEQTVWKSVPGGRTAAFPMAAEIKVGQSSLDPRQRRFQDALGCLMGVPGLWIELTDAEHELLDPGNVGSGPAHDVAEAIVSLCALGRNCDVGSVCGLLENAEAQALATQWAARVESDTDVRAYLKDCLRGLSQSDEPWSLDARRRQVAATGGDRRLIPRPVNGR